MTRADKWKERPCVMKYRSWCDHAWLCFQNEGGWPAGGSCVNISWRAFFAVPPSWSKKKKAAALERQWHFAKPDRDNIDKALLDAIYKRVQGHDDCEVSAGTIEKFWTDGQSCLEVTMLFERIEVG